MIEPAKKVRALDVVNGKFFLGDSKRIQLNYVITPLGQKVSRANLVGTVVDKFVSDDGRYSTLTIDDGSGAIRVKAFGKDIKTFDGIKPDNLVLIIGFVKQYANEIYITADMVKKVELNYEALRRLEVLDNLTMQKKIVEHIRQFAANVTRDEVKEYMRKVGIDSEASEDMLDNVLDVILEKKEADYSPKILGIIEQLDEGKGVEISKIFETCDLPDHETERALNSLLSSGRIFEPSAGKFKKI